MLCLFELVSNLAASCATLPVKICSLTSHSSRSNSVLLHLSPCFCLYYYFFSLIPHLHLHPLFCYLTFSSPFLILPLSLHKVLESRDKACCSLALSSHLSTTCTQLLLLPEQKKQRERVPITLSYPSLHFSTSLGLDTHAVVVIRTAGSTSEC